MKTCIDTPSYANIINVDADTNVSLADKIRNIEKQMLKVKLVLLGDDGMPLNIGGDKPSTARTSCNGEPSKKSENFRTLLAPIEDGLSAIVRKLGTPLMLDSFTTSIIMESWVQLSFARAMIDLRVDNDLKDNLVMVVPKIKGDGYILYSIRKIVPDMSKNVKNHSGANIEILHPFEALNTVDKEVRAAPSRTVCSNKCVADVNIGYKKVINVAYKDSNSDVIEDDNETSRVLWCLIDVSLCVVDTAYKSSWIPHITLYAFVVSCEVQEQIRRIFLDGYGVLVVRIAVS
nr:isocitrate lyase [Tanacetum cinerariifolium]